MTWYSDEKPIKSLIVHSAQPGYCSVRENGQEVIVGGNEDWKLVLPLKANPHDIMADIHTTGTRNSHVFVHQSSFDGQHISEDIYVAGLRQPVIGPFLRYLGRRFEVGEDGSTSAIVWKEAAKTTTQLLVTDVTGKLSFRVDCEESDGSPIPAPDGVGVLLPGKGGTDQDNFFGWYTGEGKRWAMQVAPNPYCIGWIPATQKSLFSTSLGYEARYRMIDWAAGRERWDIACPGGGFSPGHRDHAPVNRIRNRRTVSRRSLARRWPLAGEEREGMDQDFLCCERGRRAHRLALARLLLSSTGKLRPRPNCPAGKEALLCFPR